MFASISGRYDLLNHLLSLNTDRRWRKQAVRILSGRLPNDSVVLDVACGTGDLSMALAETGQFRVVGLDFCRPMLLIAAAKNQSAKRAVPLIEGDALSLPFASGSFAAVSIAFGLRNLANVEDGLRELLRVLKPGGVATVLDFSQPKWPGFRTAFRFYFHTVLPQLGGVISGSKMAYEYLPDSVRRFPDQEALAEIFRRVGFDKVEFLNLSGGIAAVHFGVKP